MLRIHPNLVPFLCYKDTTILKQICRNVHIDPDAAMTVEKKIETFQKVVAEKKCYSALKSIKPGPKEDPPLLPNDGFTLDDSVSAVSTPMRTLGA